MKRSLRSHIWKFVIRKIYKKHMSVAEIRAQDASAAKFAGPPPKDVQIERVNIDGIDAAWIRPSGAERTKTLLHIHGGGYVTGSIPSYLRMCILMAQMLNINVLLPAYRLAPEHPFPAAMEDVLKIYRRLLNDGFQPKDIFISGDSAGGGLCVAAVIALRDQKEALPAAVLCMSPWVDLTMQGQSHVTNPKSEAMLNAGTLREWALLYTNEKNFGSPLVSPIFADFQKFPPLLIQVSSDEVLLDDARMLAEKARAGGADVTLKIWDGLWHVWQIVGDAIPESRMAIEEIGEFIRAYR
ncbi:MAG TPA: alpha/beta hydrolase [Anaerolineales bacterium]|nr:alpha/beta hydrolase [Anaerolineales bacterium]HMX21293.1 alpha/beta hydrolase [Anaerolineales bacterium]HNA56432.1 alpha/beta hydrolase [Anaerolineales bacterium]HNC91772.1 alpha/beta hydrolase [Anaerolineales bacterium]HND94020.1 alpha/beta hydrolase [Anaerolineales bacterium]